MNHPLDARVRARLQALSDDRLLRRLRPPTGIDLSSNDYLGLAQHPNIARRMIDSIAVHGCGSTGSRLLRGHRDAFTRVEHRFAAFKGTERALYFSSGYLANLAVLTTFPERGDVVMSDERNHARLIDGARLSAGTRVIFPHADVAALARLVDQHRGAGATFIVTESLFSMDGDVAPLAEYAALCRTTGALLVVDEAHAVGMYGARGSGLVEAAGVDRDVFISVNTAGKALGVAGAFVAGPAWAVEYLIQRARPFIFSTAPPPAIAGALDASLDMIANEPERRATLAGRVRLMRGALAGAGLCAPGGVSQIVPILLGENERAVAVADVLQSQGFDVRAIRPPAVPPGTARLRIAVNVNVPEQTIPRFVAALADAAAKHGATCSAACS